MPKLIHISKDLLNPLEEERIKRGDGNIAQTARALLRQTLSERGLYDLENGEENPG